MPTWIPLLPEVLHQEQPEHARKRREQIILLREIPPPIEDVSIEFSENNVVGKMLHALKNLEHVFGASILCDWDVLRAQLLLHWPRLTMEELNKTGQNRHKIALLVEQKYNITSGMMDNYLRNYERTMPLH